MAGNSKNFLPVYHAIIAQSMTGTSTITSTPTDTRYLDNVGVQFNWTGTPNGSFFVDVSLDQVTWNAITLSPAPAATGAAGSAYIDINQISAPYLRLRYVNSSSTGTLDAYITAKSV